MMLPFGDWRHSRQGNKGTGKSNNVRQRKGISCIFERFLGRGDSPGHSGRNFLGSERTAPMSQSSQAATPTTQSSTIRTAPKLSGRGLTILLCFMCVVPVVTIAWLWSVMPPVFEGQLNADVSIVGAPPMDYYNRRLHERPPIQNVKVLVKNRGPEAWTNINVRVNKLYQIYEYRVLTEPGTVTEYDLTRFIFRNGAGFDIRFNPVKHVEIYARLPDGSRATFEKDFKALDYKYEFDEEPDGQ